MRVKFYGTPGATLRIFCNRTGGEGVTVGANEQRVTIGEDGVGVLTVADVMTATSKDYCRLSGIKILASWQGATIDTGVVIKGITVKAVAGAPAGISNIANAANVNAAYNLNGQRVNINATGIVIVNGKKFVNK